MIGRKSKIVLIALIVSSILAFGAGAAVREHFVQINVNTNVHGLVLKFDNDIAFNKIINETIDIFSGETYNISHNVSYIDGGKDTIHISFMISGGPSGFYILIFYKAHDSTEWVYLRDTHIGFICNKSIIYDLKFSYSTDIEFIPEVVVTNIELIPRYND
jgi:hypothetical protein